MRHVFFKFIIAIFIISLGFIFLPYLAVEQGWIISVPSFAVEIIFTVGVITMAVFYFLQKIQKSNPQGFVQLYLLSIAIKMLVGCVLILIIIFMDRAGAMANALLFIVSYFVLTSIEIFFLLKESTKA